MKGALKVLDAKGHTEVEYDTEAGVVEEAEKVLKQHSHSAFFDGETRERIPTKRPNTKEDRERMLSEHEEIIVVAPMAGG